MRPVNPRHDDADLGWRHADPLHSTRQPRHRYRHAILRVAQRSRLPVDEVFDALKKSTDRQASRRASLARSEALEPDQRPRPGTGLWRSSTARPTRRTVPAGRRRARRLGGRLRRRRASRPRRGAASRRIVVVGAGLAGLTAAERIHRARGWIPQVYEGQHRVGGRTRTIRSLRAGSVRRGRRRRHQLERRTRSRALAADLGLTPLVDTWRHYPPGPEQYRFGGNVASRGRQLKPGVTSIVDTAWQGWKDIGRRIPTREGPRGRGRLLRRDDGRRPDPLGRRASLASPAGTYARMSFGGEYGGPSHQASAIHRILEESDTIWESRRLRRALGDPRRERQLLARSLEGPPSRRQRPSRAASSSRSGVGPTVPIRLTFDTGAGPRSTSSPTAS